MSPTDASRTLIYESPWLEMRPLFFNARSGAVSRDVSAVVDWPNVEFDPEGLADYLDVGYSVFGHTPIKDVRFVESCWSLWRTADGRLESEPLPECIPTPVAGGSTPAECLDLVSGIVARSVGDDDRLIVVPTSGGKDSRLLNAVLREAGLGHRVRDFTFGTSDDQAQSQEVVRAREVARRCGVSWERIPLGGFLEYLDEWYGLFGPAVEAHGMYHIEFYRLVRERLGLPPWPDLRPLEEVPADAPIVLSGAVGDWFAGAKEGSPTLAAKWEGPADVIPFLRQGPEHATAAASRLRTRRDRAFSYFETHGYLATDKRQRFLEKARVRTMLLRYLLDVPRAMGFDARAPLAEEALATAMLSLPTDARAGHRWQHDFFAAVGLDVEHPSDGDTRNTLDYQALRRVPLRPLDGALLAECIVPEYVRWVNRNVSRLGSLGELYWRLGHVKGLRRASARLEARGCRSQRLPAYYAYLVLWPLQRVLERRHAARDGVVDVVQPDGPGDAT